jgi:hypothetical protein
VKQAAERQGNTQRTATALAAAHLLVEGETCPEHPHSPFAIATPFIPGSAAFCNHIGSWKSRGF